MANLLILSVGRTLSGFLSAVTAATELGGGRPVAAAGLAIPGQRLPHAVL